MTLAYYNKKDGTFHSKYYTYEQKEQCKKDYNLLKKSNALFYYSNGGMGFYQIEEHGLRHGKMVDISDLPALVANKFDKHIEEDESHDYGGKSELWWQCYENEYWYSIRIDLGEDDFENEVVNEYFITKDMKSEISR